VPVAAVTLGACLIEKHLTLSRQVAGPDSAFSQEPDEFAAMVQAVRAVEQALGKVSYDMTDKEKTTRVFRRSLFVVHDMEQGERFTSDNVRSVRPGHGLHTRFLDQVLGRRAAVKIARGTPLSWEMVG
jgi:pseudaminic acid synthase